MFLIFLSCAWALGLYLGRRWNFPAWTAALGLLPLCAVLAAKRSSRNLLIAGLSVLFLLCGAIYFPFKSPHPQPVSEFNARGVIEIQGLISAPPEFKGMTARLQLSAEKLRTASDWQNTSGTILVFTPPYPEYHYGDVLRLTGRLDTPTEFDEFDYQAYLAKQGIFSTMLMPQIELLESGRGIGSLAWVYSLRARLSDSLASALNEPQASLAQGVVLGIRSFIPDDFKAALATTGTAQLLAISGINLTIVTGLFLALFLRLFGRRRYLYVWLTLALVWFYALLTGLQAPVIRAAIMATLFLWAELLGRQKNALVALAASAAVMAAIDPQVLWDISFQLSFLAMAGLIFITPWLRSLGERGLAALFIADSLPIRISAVFLESISVSLGAILAVWPLVAYYFGLISIVGPLANIILAPALPAIILCGSITALAGLFSAPLAQMLGWLTWIPSTYMLDLTGAMANIPFAALKSSWVGLKFILPYYACLSALILRPCLSKAVWLRLKNLLATVPREIPNSFAALPKKLIVLPLLAVLLPLSLATATLPDSKMHVSFIDVGEGDACLVQWKAQNILIDGGPSPQAIVLGLGDKLKFWQKTIDLMILSHPHLDHLSGLVDVLKRYQVKQILSANLTASTPTFLEWQNQIARQKDSVQFVQAGQIVDLGGGACFEALNPADSVGSSESADFENRGLVLKLSLGAVSFLFTADIDQSQEADLLNRRVDLQSTVLKVGHHGSSTSSSPQFLKAVNPQIAVISVGLDNTFGHPDAGTLSRLSQSLASKDAIYRTDRSGTVEFSTDGARLWVKTQKP
jgi:competence protein ComEC